MTFIRALGEVLQVSNNAALLLLIFYFLVYWALNIALAIWMYKDAKSRAMSHVNWWVGVLIIFSILGFGFLGLPVVLPLLLYALNRPGQTLAVPVEAGSGSGLMHASGAGMPGARGREATRPASPRGPRLVHLGTNSWQAISKDDVFMGRDAEIRVHDPEVSNVHARIVRRQDGYYIYDVGSLNGTYVMREGREEQVSSHMLKDGDVFQLGKNPQTRYQFLGGL